MTTSRGIIGDGGRGPDDPPPTPEQVRRSDLIAHQTAFLSAYAVSLDITQAAVAADISRDLHYRWLKNDDTYPDRFALARKAAIERVEAEAFRRAVHGVKKIKVSNGIAMIDPRANQPDDPTQKVYLEETAYSDTLLVKLLSANDARYRERQEISGPNGGAIPIAGTITDELRAKANAVLTGADAIAAAVLLSERMALAAPVEPAKE